jgi:hypothetical protein
MQGDDSMSKPEETTGLNLMEMIPEHFERFFAFFQPAHTEGVAPARIKELARLKVAALNDCDT